MRYKIVNVAEQLLSSEIVAVLNQEYKEGWELVAVTQHTTMPTSVDAPPYPVQYIRLFLKWRSTKDWSTPNG